MVIKLEGAPALCRLPLLSNVRGLMMPWDAGLVPMRASCMPNPEEDALAIYDEARLDPHAPQHPVAVAERLPWIARVDSVGRFEVWGDGQTETHPKGYAILVANDLAREAEAFTIGHEIFEAFAARAGYRFGCLREKEAYCDAGSAALIAPRPAYREALLEYGENFAALAADFATTESLCALRLAEVRELSMLLVSETAVRVRGSTRRWPSCEELDLRRMATARELPGPMRRSRLTDDPRRVVVIADEQLRM